MVETRILSALKTVTSERSWAKPTTTTNLHERNVQTAFFAWLTTGLSLFISGNQHGRIGTVTAKFNSVGQYNNCSSSRLENIASKALYCSPAWAGSWEKFLMIIQTRFSKACSVPRQKQECSWNCSS